MKGDNMVIFVEEILKLLERYFVYIYPGFITILIYHFSKARGTKLNKATLGICVIISYIYILLYNFVRKTEVSKFSNNDYVILLFISILFPIIWHWISRSKWIEKVLEEMGFNTTLEDTVWDYIHNRDKEKKGIILKVFLDDKDIMYEGSLRYRESDLEKEPSICLSGYRRYVKENGKYITKQDYNNDNSRWVLINIKEITRSEIKYASEK